MKLSLRSNTYDDVTDFEIWGCYKNTKSRYLENETFFPQIKKNHEFTSMATLWQKMVLQWRQPFELKTIYLWSLHLQCSTSCSISDPEVM